MGISMPRKRVPLSRLRTSRKTMKTNIATDNLQSQRLLRCGVPAGTADMIETRSGNLLDRAQDFPFDETKETLAWSLSALLELLPKEFEYSFPFTKWYAPFQDGWDISDKENMSYINGEVRLYFSDGNWIVNYDWEGFDGKLPQSENPIEACVLAIELLSANGYNQTWQE